MTNGTSQVLFIIVSIVIFGIFVIISYLLFRDKLHVGLADVFDDSINQAKCDVFAECPINIKAVREDDNYLYAKIREADESKGETEIWVRAEKLEDGTLNIDSSNISDSNYSSGSSEMAGSLVMPDTINGKNIATIGVKAFSNSTFTGELKLPNGLTAIGDSSFYNSKFTGTLVLPSGLNHIGSASFIQSTFTGTLILPESLNIIDRNVFYNSTFNGTLNVSNIIRIQDGTFRNSKIVKVIRGNVEMADGSAVSNPLGIHPQAIKLANGEWYDGSNDN
ncbi:leucine-rich repeat domain-containing protein [Candidatus Enterenecus avicola]